MDLINAPTLTYDADRFTQSFNGTLMLRFGLRTGATRNVQKGIVPGNTLSNTSKGQFAIWTSSSSPIKLNHKVDRFGAPSIVFIFSPNLTI